MTIQKLLQAFGVEVTPENAEGAERLERGLQELQTNVRSALDDERVTAFVAGLQALGERFVKELESFPLLKEAMQDPEEFRRRFEAPQVVYITSPHARVVESSAEVETGTGTKEPIGFKVIR